MEEEGVLEETSQLWVLRHLRLVLGEVDDRILTRFVFEADITPLRNFASQFSDCHVLFLAVHRRVEPLPVPVSTAKTGKPKQKRKKDVAKPKAPVKKTMKQLKKKVKKPEKEEKEKKEKSKTKEEQLPDVVAEELKLIETTLPRLSLEEEEIRMEWVPGAIPSTNEFLFLVIRDFPKTSEMSEFDQLFHVGHCMSGNRLSGLIENAKLLLGERITFSRELQIFLHFAEVVNCGGVGRGENEFEDFIYESIGKTFAPPKRVSMTGIDQVTTIEEILKPRIEDFMRSSNEDCRSRLLLELSFFEVKTFADDRDIENLCWRLERIHDSLGVYASFFAESNEKFFRKLYPFVVEHCFKIIAENIKRKCEYLENDFFKEIDGSPSGLCITQQILPRIAEILALEGHEFALLAKTKQNFRLLEVLEGDLDEIKRLVTVIRSSRFDTLWSRALLQKAEDEVKALLETLSENCLELMLEGANFEALRAFCSLIDSHRLAIQAVLQELP